VRVNLWVGVLIGVGGFGILPGPFVPGFALAQAGFAEALGRLSGALWVAQARCAVLAVVAYLVVVSGPGGLAGRWLGLAFSMYMAGGYAALFLVAAARSGGPGAVRGAGN
jgi:hypothetical protein